MPIYLNGGSNPTSVTYNGTSLDYAYATVNGISAPYAVWERPNIAPSTLSTICATFANGSTIYFNDMVKQGTCRIAIVYSDRTEVFDGALYEGTMSAQMYFEEGYQTNTYEVGETAGVPRSTTTTTSVTGLPSGFTIHQAYGPWSSSNTIAFDVYKTTGYTLRPEDLEIMNLQARVVDDMGIGYISIKGPGHGWPIVNRTNGWIYQGPATLILRQSQ